MKLYRVDWSDSAFPEIVEADEDYPAEGMSFTGAKQQIIDTFQERARHAREQIRKARSMTQKEVGRS